MLILKGTKASQHLRGYAINQRVARLEEKVAEHDKQIDFFVRTDDKVYHLERLGQETVRLLQNGNAKRTDIAIIKIQYLSQLRQDQLFMVYSCDLLKTDSKTAEY